MVIAIEGMDGSGKTTVAKKTAEKLGYEYNPKAMQKVLELEDDNYLNLVTNVRKSNNKSASSLFFTLKCLFDNEKKDNIIVERSILSLYFYERENVGEAFFKNILSLGILPDLIIILHASVEERMKRIKQRNANDRDLIDPEVQKYGYDTMTDFALANGVNYLLIDTDKYNENQVVEICTSVIKKYEETPEDDKKELLDVVNKQFGISKKPIARELRCYSEQ